MASAIEKERGEDPSLVVIDEVVGQWLALIFLPAMSWKIATVAFLLFRLFDIWKPFPIDYSQQLKGGWGLWWTMFWPVFMQIWFCNLYYGVDCSNGAYQSRIGFYWQ